jgi:hypothetical protein
MVGVVVKGPGVLWASQCLNLLQNRKVYGYRRCVRLGRNCTLSSTVYSLNNVLVGHPEPEGIGFFSVGNVLLRHVSRCVLTL